ncbi:hypothetical protein NP233_g8050 [Leucocoprinus birnbaumii]|uniref:Copper radical oxidase n=1 Tax=Leucocoprinus birnbaumii TaxID=56174 RepID=A0AAD5YNG8_9AGAR|nr:hypothetical protein NP233_g8050 [Leucocoprinus birnbaumii]
MAPFHSFLLSLLLAAGSVNAHKNSWTRRSVSELAQSVNPVSRYPSTGLKIYDSNSPVITYEGKWSTAKSELAMSGSLRTTQERGASFSLAFTGSGIEWLGDCDKFHGYAQVYLDGKGEEKVDLSCEVTNSRQRRRLFRRTGLGTGQHVIKIVNIGQPSSQSRLSTSAMNIDALVVMPGWTLNAGSSSPQKPLSVMVQNQTHQRRGILLSGGGPPRPKWELSRHGTTGVAAMQLSIVSPSHAIIFDKVEHNPLMINGHGAWAALYDLNTDAVRPLEMKTNSFCAGGAFLSNGTLVSVGGAPVDKPGFGDINGLQAIRLFHPCEWEYAEKCEVYENLARIHMASSRWYPTSARLDDGSIIIVGGSTRGDYINNPGMNNPTIEFWPPKGIHGSNGMPIPMQFLKDTLNANLFPIVFLLPDGKLFIAANNDAMIYDWRKNVEKRLPSLPNGVRITYPMTGVGLLLPLTYENDYTPEVMICGGSNLSDTTPPEQLSTQDPASAQCVRMVLTEQGIALGWQVEQMPEPRVMPDAVILPTGEIVIVNGGKSGLAGYGNLKNQVGQSNADNPVLTPVIYNPRAPRGKRFCRDEEMPTSSIPRLYHSVATLTPRGDIMIAGSNPNFDRSEVRYATEYRVEWLSPPYMRLDRPSFEEVPHSVEFREEFTVRLSDAVGEGQEVKVALMDFGFVSHSVHMNSRHVWLPANVREDAAEISVTAPPHEKIYPPGPAWLFVLVDGVPSQGFKIMVGAREPQAVIDNIISKGSRQAKPVA